MSAVVVEIGADARSFQKAVDGLPQMVKGAASGLTAAVAGIGLTALIKQATQTVTEFDRMKRGMTTLEGSAEKASDRINELSEASRLPGVDFKQAVQADIKLRSVGVTAEMSKSAIIEFGNALSLAGGTSSDLDGVILALTQIISKGKVSAEEINQIAERVPQVRSVMKNMFGTSDTDALQKMNISAEQFVNTLIQGFSQLTRASAGLDESLADIGTAVDEATVALASGFVGEGVSGLGNMANMLRENIDLFRELGGAIGGVTKIGFNTFKVINDTLANTTAAIGLMITDGKSIGEAFKAISDLSGSKLDSSPTSTSVGKRAGMTAGGFGIQSLPESIMSSLRNSMPAFLNPFSQIIQSQLNEQSRKLSAQASALQGVAFGGLKGDVDTSYGRGTSMNPLSNGASRMISELVKQSAVLQQQARSMDKGNAYLSEIEKAVKKFNMTYQ
jgi:tape measure domain-containing protein